jgi:undecaprenyl-diphosphatase
VKTPPKGNKRPAAKSKSKDNADSAAREVVRGREVEFWGIGLISSGIVFVLAMYLRMAGPLGRGIDTTFGWLLGLGRFALPVVVIGLVFKNQIENQLRNLWIVAVMLIVFGIVLALADRFGPKTKSIENLSTRDGLLFGLAQALAVIPGVSRSGGTISMGLFLGYSRQAAARYSFLLAIPAVVASGTFEFATSYQDLAPGDLAATGGATLVSFLVGFAVIVGFLRYLSRGSFMPFVIWRLAVGFALLALLSTGALVA